MCQTEVRVIELICKRLWLGGLVMTGVQMDRCESGVGTFSGWYVTISLCRLQFTMMQLEHGVAASVGWHWPVSPGKEDWNA